ncbi:MAG TPA: dihydrolipoamide acyltransferase [Candidatus Anaerotruncus excrementipullorum]|uniref:Dihydrolipoamide acyltransferase n=1 Tax=Candidatus Anaerotruncus excrementipullorum TaxID=2838465 RepID=A0A9D2B7P5_9FIRM|nr:dihydrolipoamide acyltransferase [Candidatus Anaerotruncus excrementipullorum]
MIAAMEQAACGALAPFLQEGQTSVGTALQIEHTAPTPLGMEVEVTATITAVEGRRIDFTVEARDAVGNVGHGTHSRFLVDAARFQEKADRKGGRV